MKKQTSSQAVQVLSIIQVMSSVLWTWVFFAILTGTTAELSSGFLWIIAVISIGGVIKWLMNEAPDRVASFAGVFCTVQMLSSAWIAITR